MLSPLWTMEVSFLLQCPPPPPSRAFSGSLRFKYRYAAPKPVMKAAGGGRISATTVPARDRVIDFGRHKGKMLGSLPSTYLRWLSNNLRAGDFVEWAMLADQVLADAVYRDRIEWEFAQKVLDGNVVSSRSSSSLSSQSAVSELLEISDRFGWDNDDKDAWRNINFALLGTSKGGRIPRRLSLPSPNRNMPPERDLSEKSDRKEARMGGERRRERRERVRLKRRGDSPATETETSMSVRFGNGSTFGDDKANSGYRDPIVDNHSPFPGRQSLLNRVLNNNSPKRPFRS